MDMGSWGSHTDMGSCESHTEGSPRGTHGGHGGHMGAMRGHMWKRQLNLEPTEVERWGGGATLGRRAILGRGVI
eukprot:5487984-Prymnesium_polylepis.1